MSKLWGGRFDKPTDELVHQLNASISFDARLYDEDISGSVAWARGLSGAGVLNNTELETIVSGLEKVRIEFGEGVFEFQPGDEDIHTAVERRLTEIIGPVAGKLHTGRSRNDQVATDFRLWVMKACNEILVHLVELQRTLVDHAEAYLDLAMPGYTHLQHAQPITWGHWVLSHFWPLARDAERYAQVLDRAAVLPLGSAALAGSAFPVDREMLARELGFAKTSQNSLDAVSDRDFAADFLYAAAMLGIHLSRLSEQLILFSSSEFGFVVIDDAYSTGSSLMPQKRNPDTLELTRGKSGRLIGRLTGLLTTLKGLPSTYDKDLQEDKEPVFDAYDTLVMTLPVMSGLLQTVQLRRDQIEAQLEPSLLATDLADYLVKKGVPFREAHHIVGQVVTQAEAKQVPLTLLTLAELRSICEQFDEDVESVFELTTALASRSVKGGTAPSALEEQLRAAKEAMDQ
jgi:argininosuccinate lyase